MPRESVRKRTKVGIAGGPVVIGVGRNFEKATQAEQCTVGVPPLHREHRLPLTITTPKK